MPMRKFGSDTPTSDVVRSVYTQIRKDGHVHRGHLGIVTQDISPEMVKALKLLTNDIEGEQIKLFYHDHPELQERIKYLSAYLGARADKVTPQMELNREKSAYFAKTESIMRHDIQLAINAARFRSALYLAQRLVDFRPNSAENVFWLAESYRTLGPRSPQLTDTQKTSASSCCRVALTG